MGVSGRAIVAACMGSSLLVPLGCSLLAGLPSDYGLAGEVDAAAPVEAANEANPPDRVIGIDSPAPPVDAGLDAGCGDTQTSGSNCGACGHSCLGGSCLAGVCQPVTLVKGETSPQELLLLGTQLYWAASSGIRNCTLPDCSSPTTLCPANGGYGLAGDTSNLYWTQYGDNTIQTAPTAGCDGGSPTLLESEIACGVSGIAYDGVGAYWANNCNPGGGVSFYTPDGGTLTTIASNQNDPTGVALDPGDVYWTNSQDSTNAVVRAGRDGSDAGTIGQGGGAYRIALALGAARVFWTNAGDDTIGVATLDGTDAGSPFATGQANPSGIIVDGTQVIWTNYAQGVSFAGTVRSCPISGCTQPVTLASGLNGPGGLAVDSQRVYWSDSVDGTIMAVAK